MTGASPGATSVRTSATGKNRGFEDEERVVVHHFFGRVVMDDGVESCPRIRELSWKLGM